jgi:glycosyltransferase involved in cell wall biosynthesis
MEIKHSVLIAAYNNEKDICHCLNSLINQTYIPFEIVISDDHSNDKTWDIIKSYKSKYKDLFQISRNTKNLGIFENIAKVKSMARGNIISCLGADDYYKPNTLEEISKSIHVHNLNPDIDSFIIALNTIHKFPNGKEWVWNNFKYRNYDKMRLRLRFGLSYRSVGLSKSLISKVPSEKDILEINESFALGADWIKGFEEIRLADKIVFVNYAGPVYRLGSGSTSKISLKESVQSKLNLIPYIENHYSEYWDSRDLRYIKSLKFSNLYMLNPNFINFVLSLYYSIININNHTSNYPWIRSLKIYLPNNMLKFVKNNIYPLVRKFI